MPRHRYSDWDRSESDSHHRNSGEIAAQTGQSFERQHYNYDGRRTYEEPQAYKHDQRNGRDMSSSSTAQRDSPALRSCFVGSRNRLDEPHRDPRDSDRPRQRYAESFQPRRPSPSPIRPDRQSNLDNGYGDDEYHHSSSRHKPARRSGSRNRIAFEEQRGDENRYVYRYSAQPSDKGYDDRSSGHRSSRRESNDRYYDDKDEYRQRRR